MVHKTAHRDISLFPVRILKYPYAVSTVFPSSVEEQNGRIASRVASSLPKANGNALREYNMLKDLLVVDYRYSRFALDPRTGMFSMIRYPNVICVVCLDGDIPSGHGGIRLGTGYHLCRVDYSSPSEPNDRHYLGVTRLTSKQNQQFLFWSTK